MNHFFQALFRQTPRREGKKKEANSGPDAPKTTRTEPEGRAERKQEGGGEEARKELRQGRCGADSDK